MNPRLLSAFIAAWFLGCSDEMSQWRDTNRPPSFGTACEGDAGLDVCESPFTCMRNASFSGAMQCTLACDSDDDCPRWEATGHCAGPFQSRCEANVCQPQRCR